MTTDHTWVRVYRQRPGRWVAEVHTADGGRVRRVYPSGRAALIAIDTRNAPPTLVQAIASVFEGYSRAVRIVTEAATRALATTRDDYTLAGPGSDA